MVGNDIVDLTEANLKSNWQRPRFLEKLFSSHEQHLIQNTDDSFLMVWRLWSMKEAAYKLFTQLHPSRFYNPKQFECEINDLKGNVKYKVFECYVDTRITSQFILSEARLSLKHMDSACLYIASRSSKIQSDILKEAILSKVSERFNIIKQDLKLIKSEFGIPYVHQNSKKSNISISISHHGNYGAFVMS
jgi:phosphopantetheine--protein transferase-like protein